MKVIRIVFRNVWRDVNALRNHPFRWWCGWIIVNTLYAARRENNAAARNLLGWGTLINLLWNTGTEPGAFRSTAALASTPLKDAGWI